MKLNINNNNSNNTSNHDDDDALSLRDLQLYDQTATSSTRSSPRAASSPELFEFFPTLPSPNATENIVFCGKVISNSDDTKLDDKTLNKSVKNREYRCSSSRLPDRQTKHVIPMRSVSNRDLGSPRHGVKFSSSVKKVNIEKLTSVSSKSKRRLFMLGPVKFVPEMEMGSLRERQGRRNPSSRMFPVTEDAIKMNTDNGKSGVRCRARLNSVFERSFACLRI
ncbi:hypothetical protein HanIR_Chr07g0322501 [Helianthus annuus]|nr:hypothetical protein HanIR_Chr07g0322501 [Helianthus annuus]